MDVTISLIMCTRDRAARLRATLERLRALAFAPGDEAVLVDNGSTDGTREVLLAFAACAPFRIEVVLEPHRGAARARNAGIARARGAILAFVDDDCYPAPDFLDAVRRVFAADAALGYAGGRIVLHDPLDAAVAVRTDTAPREIAPGSFVPAGLVQSANLAARRACVAAIGGFDPELGHGARFACEDVDFAARASAAGWKGGYFPGPLVRHHHGRRPGRELAVLWAAYDLGRGAYYAKCLLHGPTRRACARELLGAAARRARAKLRELEGALRYLLFFLRTRAAA